MTIALAIATAAALLFFGLWLYELLCRFEAINEGVQEYRIALKFIAGDWGEQSARFAAVFLRGDKAEMERSFPDFEEWRSKCLRMEHMTGENP